MRVTFRNTNAELLSENDIPMAPEPKEYVEIDGKGFVVASRQWRIEKKNGRSRVTVVLVSL